MNPRVRAFDDSALLLGAALLGAFIWRYWHSLNLKHRQQLLFWIGSMQVLALILIVLWIIYYRQRNKYKRLLPKQWQKMSGVQFERQMIIWLAKNGFSSLRTTEYYDQGVGIVAVKDGVSFGIQVKRSARPVGVSAVRAVVAGLKSYNCEQAMVVTNASFTAQARNLAMINNCRLIDGSELIRGAASSN